MTIEIILPASAAAIAEGEYRVGVRVYGLEFACRHIAGELRVDNVSGPKYNARRPSWQKQKNADAVRDWFAAEVAKLGAEYHAAHRALYELEAV
jgi:hypothetical protein